MTKAIIEEINKITQPPGALEANTILLDTGLDSLSFVALIVALEERFAFVLSDELLDIGIFETIEDLAASIPNTKGGT